LGPQQYAPSAWAQVSQPWHASLDAVASCSGEGAKHTLDARTQSPIALTRNLIALTQNLTAADKQLSPQP